MDVNVAVVLAWARSPCPLATAAFPMKTVVRQHLYYMHAYLSIKRTPILCSPPLRLVRTASGGVRPKQTPPYTQHTDDTHAQTPTTHNRHPNTHATKLPPPNHTQAQTYTSDNAHYNTLTTQYQVHSYTVTRTPTTITQKKHGQA